MLLVSVLSELNAAVSHSDYRLAAFKGERQMTPPVKIMRAQPTQLEWANVECREIMARDEALSLLQIKERCCNAIKRRKGDRQYPDGRGADLRLPSPATSSIRAQ